MARPIRIEFENAMYHVTNRGIGGQPIFFDDEDRMKFLSILSKVKQKYSILNFTYILMTNHYHLQIQTLLPNLSRAIQYLQSVYAIYFNRKYDRRGHLFEKRFLALLIDKGTYFFESNRYINLNAVRAGIVNDILDYKWCGIQEYAGQTKFSVVDKEYVLSHFDENNPIVALEKYLSFCRAGIGKKWPDFEKNIYGKTILGSNEFTKKVKQLISNESLSESVSTKRKLVARKSKERILRIVDDYYSKNRGIDTRNEIVNMKIYLLASYTDMTLTKIGKYFNNLKSSAVNKRYMRFKMKVLDDNNIKQKLLKMKELIDETSIVEV